MQDLSLIELIDEKDRKNFYQSNIFHERQMNSCPIGCQGCAVSAAKNVNGGLNYSDIKGFYQDAAENEVQLKITKVEGYDPVFVNYPDAPEVSFAQTVKDAVDYGHEIITPICTTGNWRSEKTKWQIEELGKLDNKYRFYRYPSGNKGTGFVLSVPREIRPFSKSYDYESHIEKLVFDINALTVGGNIEVLIYFNSHVDGDVNMAEKIKADLQSKINTKAKERADLVITDFNAETMPESCMRYGNSILVSDKGFFEIDKEALEWTTDPNTVGTQVEIALKLAAA